MYSKHLKPAQGRPAAAAAAHLRPAGLGESRGITMNPKPLTLNPKPYTSKHAALHHTESSMKQHDANISEGQMGSTLMGQLQK